MVRVQGERFLLVLRNPGRRAVAPMARQVRIGARSLRAERLTPSFTIIGTMRGGTTRYIGRGFYADELSRWYEQFDPSAILVLRSEDLFADVRTVYEPLARFLDLEAVDLGPLVVPNAGRYPDVDPGLVRELEAIYSEPNRRLAKLLGTATWW